MADVLMKTLVDAITTEQMPSSTTPLSRLLYPYYQAPTGSTIVVRFLPDKDEANKLPWIETHAIRLPFGGITNSDHNTSADTIVTVPALSQWGRKDRITESLRHLWQGTEDDRRQAKVYYRKISYLLPGLVYSSPLVEKQEPESPIRLFRLGRQLFQVLDEGLKSGEFEWSPFGFDHGRDFKIVKTAQGQFANYSTSSFSYKERALNKTEREQIAKHGLLDLSQFAGIEPDQDVIDMVWEMYQASLVGAPFDNAKWGSHFRAFESGNPTNGAALPTPSRQERDEAVADVMNAVHGKVINTSIPLND